MRRGPCREVAASTVSVAVPTAAGRVSRPLARQRASTVCDPPLAGIAKVARPLASVVRRATGCGTAALACAVVTSSMTAPRSVLPPASPAALRRPGAGRPTSARWCSDSPRAPARERVLRRERRTLAPADVRWSRRRAPRGRRPRDHDGGRVGGWRAIRLAPQRERASGADLIPVRDQDRASGGHRGVPRGVVDEEPHAMLAVGQRGRLELPGERRPAGQGCRRVYPGSPSPAVCARQLATIDSARRSPRPGRRPRPTHDALRSRCRVP